MKRKTVKFLITLCWGESLILLSILMGRYETQMPRGFSQVAFLVGLILGVISVWAFNKVDARFADNKGWEEVTE